ncbi:Tpr family protein [Theileria parva strain Muguga]|uniref:Uncharacterized protein n=1 Tax=Theileria parva TaxID=5875 RepID=Q4MYC4_THEPA|nr:uncharacterized protein TpMuguga_03g00927 [Theileria parva strain Muguga]XP_762730.1 uncharacterized protein TpMuguga_03g00915 [Theileria parva strain Muguga]EAN30435.1 Tpr family protein [Theileria parva strain Muguga]EAN30447.1 Tpr family protein [Theileria parva strain Muguga]|eukprot:XP_762718.1 hypothetical protein [Theileria parva strain Muguga]
MVLGSSQILAHYETLIPASAHALKKEASNLSQKAGELSTKALALKNGVEANNAEAAKVLKAKAGKEQEEGKLRKLAETLHTAAHALHNAVGGKDSSKASGLAAAVGADETSDTGKLRSNLKTLAEATGTGTGLTGSAQAVTDQYTQVESKFSDVQTQNTSQKYDSYQSKYKAVVDAWEAFNAVYKAEDNLYNALNSGSVASNLQQSLSELSSANAGDFLDVCSQASDALKKYNALTEAIEKPYDKLEAVKKFETAYKSTTGNIKTNYESIVNNLTDLKNGFTDALRINKFWIIVWPSVIAQWLNFLTYLILLIVYVPGDSGHLTMFYWVIAISGFVFGFCNVTVFAIDVNYLPIYIAGENCFPATTSLIHYLSSLMFGNRRKWNSDFLMVYIDLVVAILISFAAAAMWTLAYLSSHAKKQDKSTPDFFWHINPPGGYQGEIVDPKTFMPFLMVLVGMGLVYCIYPAIAPGMIVPFYLVDKIEMVLLIATIFPPLIVAIVTKYKFGWSPKAAWTDNSKDFFPGSPCNYMWHFFDLVIPTMIILAYLFIYSLHYRDSSVARSIINQPKMSTCLTILFYMCHEISLAVGFPGIFGGNGGGSILALTAQLIGAFLMCLLAPYSEGYIIEYKRHDPSNWPTAGMTRWNALRYWTKMASKNCNKNLAALFTKDLRRDLLLCIERNELI